MTKLAALLRVQGASLEVYDDFDAVNAIVCERGWGDGLPIVPPTEERVQAMLAWCDRPWDEPIAKIAPRYGEATPLRLAANAVMAGCKPTYFPLVMLAIQAMCEEPFNLYSVQATTHPCTPLLIFNGPVSRELGINAGNNVFGPGVQANATIGRAIRLALLNIGGALPGVGDMATHGSPAKYSYCIAENEAESPWEPLHVERGFPLEASTVTVVDGESPHNINDHESITAESILTTIAGTMATTGNNCVYNMYPQPVVVLGPEHAHTIAEGGFSKAAVKSYLQEHAWLPHGKFSKENIAHRFPTRMKGVYNDAHADTRTFMLQRAEDIIVVVVGGAGKHSMYIPTFGTRSVTLALTRRDGQFAQSVEEFRQATESV